MASVSRIANRRLDALARTNRFNRVVGSSARPPSPVSASPTEPDRPQPPVGTDAALHVLAFTPPGEWSDAQCSALRSVDPATLSERDLLSFIEAVERMKAHWDAMQVRALAVLDRRDSSGLQVVREEVACVLRVAPLAAAQRLGQARALTDHLPLTLAALDAGELSLRHTAGLCSMAGRVDPLIARQVEAAVLTDATHLTPTAIRRAVQQAVLCLDPGGSSVRYEHCVADRSVTVSAADDGMAWLNVYGPAHDVQAIHTRLDAAARLLPREDSRTLPQRRFDLLVDGVLTGIPADGLPTLQGRAPQIQVTVAATTLLGLDDRPAELTGYGAVTADAARQAAADCTGTWRRIITDPVTGQILDYGRTTYRPPQNLIDHVTARDKTCRFPGCSMLAHKADLDHVVPWDQGGETKPDNLATLCRRHHQLKTKKYWHYEMDSGGAITWTSANGNRYDSQSSDTRSPHENQSKFTDAPQCGPPEDDPPPY